MKKRTELERMVKDPELLRKRYQQATKQANAEADRERAKRILAESKQKRRKVKSHMTTMQKIELGIKLMPKEIVGLNDSFKRYGNNLEQRVTAEGEGVLIYATYRSLPCGCSVIGNGSGAFPLTVNAMRQARQIRRE